MPDIVLSNHDVALPNTADQLLPATPELTFPTGVGQAANPFEQALGSFEKTIAQGNQIGQMNVPFASALKPAMRYTDPELGYHPFDDQLEYKYADAHPWQTLGNNILQFGARTAGAFLESVATIPIIISAAASNDFSKLYDNALTNNITDWLDSLNESLPTYRSEYEEEHPVLKYLNFLQPSAMMGAWGGAVNNLGFTAGAIAGAVVTDIAIGAATGGVGLLPTMGAQGAKLMNAISKAGKAVALADDAALQTSRALVLAERGVVQAERALVQAEAKAGFQAAGRVDDLLAEGTQARQAAVNRLSRLNKIASDVRYNLGLTTSAAAEGAFEAAEVYHRGIEDLKQEFFDRYGRSAVGDELALIEKTSKEAADVTMKGNMAILYLSNRVNWGSLFQSTERKMAQEGITGWFGGIKKVSVKGKLTDITDDAGTTMLGKEFKYAVESVAPATRIGKVLLNAEKIGRIGARSINESVEEGLQFTLSEGSLQYARDKYNPYVMNEAANLLKGFKYGLDKTVNTNEGWDNMIGGFIGGLLGGGVMGRIQRKMPISEQMAKQVEMLNGSNFNGVFGERLKDVIAQNSMAKRYEEQVRAKDVFAAKNTHYDMLFNWVNSGYKANAFDRRMDELDTLRALEGDGFKAKWGLEDTNENRAIANKFLDGMKEKSLEIKANIEKVRRITKNPFKPTDGLNYGAYEMYKDELAHNLSAFTEYKRRINGMTAELKAKFPLMDVAQAVNLTSVQGMNTVIKQTNEAIAQLDTLISESADNQEAIALYNTKKEALQSIAERLQGIVNTGTVQTSTDAVTGARTETGRTDNVQFDGQVFLDALEDLYDLYNGTSLQDSRYVQKYVERNQPNRDGVLDITAMQTSEALLDDDTKADLLEKLQDIYKLTEANYNIGKFYTYLRKGVGATEYMKAVYETAQRTRTIMEAREKEAYVAEREEYIREEEIAAIVPEEGDEDLSKEEEATMRKAAEKVVKKKPLTKEEEEVVEKKPKIFKKYVNAEKRTKSRLAEEGIEETEQNKETQNEDDTQTPPPVNAAGEINPFAGIRPQNLFGMFSQDLAGSKLRTNLYNLIFKNSKSAAAVVQNLFANFTTDIGQYGTTIKPIPGTKLFRKPFEENLRIFNNDEQIGILRPPTSVYLDEQATRTIFDMTEAEYPTITGNQANTYADFMKYINQYRDSYNALKAKTQNGEKVSAEDILNFFNITINLGSREASKNAAADINLRDLTHLPEGSALVSLDSKGVPTIVNLNELNAKQAKEAKDFIAANKALIGTSHRYVVLLPILGEYRKAGVVIARNAETTKEEREELVSSLKQVASAALTEEEANDKLVQISEKFYITASRDKEGLYIDFRFDDDFNPYVRFFNRNAKLIEEVPLPKAVVQSLTNAEDLIKAINAAVATAEGRQTSNTPLSKMALRLNVDSIKRQIPPNDEVEKLSDLGNVIKLATPTNDVFVNFNLEFDPIAPAAPVANTTPQPSPSPAPANTLPKDLAGAKPRYSYGSKKFTLSFANDIDKAAYIAAQSRKSPRDVDYVQFVIDNTGLTEAEVRELGARVREAIKQIAKTQEGDTEIAVPTVYAPQPEAAATVEAPVIAVEQPVAPTVIEPTYVDTKEALIPVLKNLFNLTDEQAAASAELFDANAQAWATRTGQPVQDYYKQLGFGDQAAFEALADTTGVLNQIIGEEGVAQLTDSLNIMNNLGLAKLMQSRKMYSRQQIRQATGWELMGDGKWRYEIADTSIDKAALETKLAEFQEVYDEYITANPGGTTPPVIEFKLGELLGADSQLMQAYPQLAEFDVAIYGDENWASGFTNFADKAIGIKDRPLGAMYSTLLHEVQHVIQNIEGFPTGANTTMLTTPSSELQDLAADISNFEFTLTKEQRSALRAALKEKGLRKRYGYFDVVKDDENILEDGIEGLEILANLHPEISEKAISLLNKLSDKVNKSEPVYEKYRRVAGEVEARNVQARIGLTDLERLDTTLNSTEDIDEESKIYLNNKVNIALDNTGNSDIEFLRNYLKISPRYQSGVFVGYTSANGLSGKRLVDRINQLAQEKGLNVEAYTSNMNNNVFLRKTAPLFQGEEDANITRAIEIVNSGVVKGFSARPLIEAANTNTEAFKGFLKEIAEQAADPRSAEAAVRTYGQELVDIAVGLNPLFQDNIENYDFSKTDKRKVGKFTRDDDFGTGSFIKFVIKEGNKIIDTGEGIALSRYAHQYNKPYSLFMNVDGRLVHVPVKYFTEVTPIKKKNIDNIITWFEDIVNTNKLNAVSKDASLANALNRDIFSHEIYLSSFNYDSNINYYKYLKEHVADKYSDFLSKYPGIEEFTANNFYINLRNSRSRIDPEDDVTFEKYYVDIYSLEKISDFILYDEYDYRKDRIDYEKAVSKLSKKEQEEIGDFFEEEVDINAIRGITTNTIFSDETFQMALNEKAKEMFNKETISLEELKDFTAKVSIKPSILNQDAKGAFDQLTRIIYGLTNPDITTPHHELAHSWEKFLTNAERQTILDWAHPSLTSGNIELDSFDTDFTTDGKAGRTIEYYTIRDNNGNKIGDTSMLAIRLNSPTTDLNEHLKEANKIIDAYNKKAKTWTRETSEAFARGFEVYLAEGNTTNNEALNSLFAQFAKWIAEVYADIKQALGIELNEPMREIYANMLNSTHVTAEVKATITAANETATETTTEQSQETKQEAKALELAQAAEQLQETIDALPLPGEVEESDYNDMVASATSVYNDMVKGIEAKYAEQPVEEAAAEEVASPTVTPAPKKRKRKAVKVTEAPIETLESLDAAEEKEAEVEEPVQPAAIPMQYVSFMSPSGETEYGIVTEIDGNFLTIKTADNREVYRTIAKVNNITEKQYNDGTNPNQGTLSYNGVEYKPKFSAQNTVEDAQGNLHVIESVELVPDAVVFNNTAKTNDGQTIVTGTRDVKDSLTSAKVIYTTTTGLRLSEDGIRRRVFNSGQDQKELKDRYTKHVKSIDSLLARLSQFFGGIRYEYVELPFNAPARFYKGVVQINLNHIETLTRNSDEILVHEFMHPFVKSLKMNNLKLYNSLLAELQANYPQIVAEAAKSYNETDFKETDLLDEALTIHLGRSVAQAFRNVGASNNTSILYSDTTLSQRSDGMFDVIYKGEVLGQVQSKVSFEAIQALADEKSRELNPLSQQRKNLYVRFRTWFNNVIALIKDQKSVITTADFIKKANAGQKKFKFFERGNLNSSIEFEKDNDAYISVYIDPSSIKDSYDVHNIALITNRFIGTDYANSNESFTENDANALELVIDKYYFGSKQSVNKNTFTTAKLNGEMNLDQLATFIGSQLANGDVISGFEFEEADLDAFDLMEAYFDLTDDQLKAMRKRISDKFDLLKETADKRIQSETLTIQKNAARRIELDSKNDLEYVLGYMEHAAVSINLAYVKYGQLLRKLKENEGVMSRKELNALNKEFAVLRQLISYYDQFSSYTQFADELKDENGKSNVAYYAKAFATQQRMREGMQDLATRLTVEWLAPYAKLHSDLMKEQGYTDEKYEITYDKLYKLFRYGGGRDTNFITFWLGSNVTSRDPINAIFANTLGDMLSVNNIKIAEKADDFAIEYDKFLKAKGFGNGSSALHKYYKDNFMRKAKVIMVDTDPNTGVRTERIVEKWALHQEYKFDEYELDLEKEKAKYKNPKSNAQALEFQAKLEAFKKANNNGRTAKYANPDYAKAAAEPFFKTIEGIYNESNLRYGTNQLRFGILPQKYSVSKAEKLKRLAEIAKGENKLSNLGKAALEGLAGGQNVDLSYNLDGSVFRNINTTLTTIKEDENISTSLEDIMPSFIVESNNYSTLRETQYNAETLMLLLEGNQKLSISPRTFAQEDFNSKIRQPFQLKALADKLKELEALKAAGDPSFDQAEYDKLKEKYEKGVQPYSLYDSVAKRFRPGGTNYNNQALLGMIKDRYFGESVEEVKIGKISATKAAHLIRLYTSINNMAGNYVAGLGNITVGNTQLFIEAHGGKYFTKADLAKAIGSYTTNIPNYIADLQRPIKSKDTQLSIMLDAIQGEIENEFGEIVTGNIAQKMFRTSSLFLLTRAGEHQLQITNMKAMMFGKKVMTNKGEEINLYDAFVTDAEGRVSLRKDIKFTQEDLTKFIRDMHGVNRMLNGNYSDLHKTMLQRKWYGNLLLSYRKYLYPSIRARYGSERVDFERNTVEVGYLRYFFFDYIPTGLGNILKGKGGFPAWKNLKPHQKYALRKTTAELGMYGALTALGVGLFGSGDDDKKSELTEAQKFGLLMLLRLRSDIGMYHIDMPSETIKQLKSPTASLQTIVGVFNVFKQLFSAPFEVYEQDYGIHKEGDSKLRAKMYKLIPLVSKFQSTTDDKLGYYDLLNRNIGDFIEGVTPKNDSR